MCTTGVDLCVYRESSVTVTHRIRIAAREPPAIRNASRVHVELSTCGRYVWLLTECGMSKESDLARGAGLSATGPQRLSVSRHARRRSGRLAGVRAVRAVRIRCSNVRCVSCVCDNRTSIRPPQRGGERHDFMRNEPQRHRACHVSALTTHVTAHAC